MAGERVGVHVVSTGCLCTPSQLQAQVAALSREVSRLQRQRERSLGKASARVKVVRSHPLPSGAVLNLPHSGPSVQARVPGTGWPMGPHAPAPLPVLKTVHAASETNGTGLPEDRPQEAQLRKELATLRAQLEQARGHG